MVVECPLCNVEHDRILLESEHFRAIFDEYPVSPGHTLVITKAHKYEDYNHLPLDLKRELVEFTDVVIDYLSYEYKPNGWNVGCNCGKAAGQSINHFHLHIIPRYNGDVENPRGGVRGVIPNKQNY